MLSVRWFFEKGEKTRGLVPANPNFSPAGRGVPSKGPNTERERQRKDRPTKG
jgi:hypothetical protein